MQLSMFDATPYVQERSSPPLVKLGDTTYRFEVRWLWCPDAQRGTVAAEVTDDATRELFAWQLRPGAQGMQELLQQVRYSMEWLYELLDFYDEPF